MVVQFKRREHDLIIPRGANERYPFPTQDVPMTSATGCTVAQLPLWCSVHSPASCNVFVFSRDELIAVRGG